MKKQFRSTGLRHSIGLAVSYLLGMGILADAQEYGRAVTAQGGGGGPFVTYGGIAINDSNHVGTVRGFSINGSGGIGEAILKTCDLDHDGKVSLVELKEVASACFKLWDTNSDGSLSQNELSAALKELFPHPPGGRMGAMRVVNGVAVQVPLDELPTPDKQVAKHILAGADANKDGALSLQELNDFLDKSFSQWDQDGNGSLDAQELNAAFGQLAIPD